MKNILLYSLTLVLLNSCAQTNKIAFYNVENIFDTIDDKHKNDNEFLPEGNYKWTKERYETKLKHTAEVVNALGKPLIMGLCEVENATVVRDLINVAGLKKSHGLVHYESPDDRGIDACFIYDSTKIKLLTSGYIRFSVSKSGEGHTRDIVWGKLLAKKDTLFVMINHWPSRRGGQEESDAKRVTAAKNARNFIDSVMTASPNSGIILMGDLNDYPDNNAPKLIAERLAPQISSKSGEFGGSYLYKGEWNILDHIFVSDNLLDKKGLKIIENSAKIHSFDFIMEEYKGVKQPKRTYVGQKYLGGYADHLPVSIDIKF